MVAYGRRVGKNGKRLLMSTVSFEVAENILDLTVVMPHNSVNILKPIAMHLKLVNSIVYEFYLNNPF